MKTTQRKVCTTCDKRKGLDAFHKCKKGRFGVQAVCKVCRKTKAQSNNDHLNAYNRAWRKAHPEQARATQKAWKNTNYEKIKMQKEAWSKVNLEKIQGYRQKWAKTNVEKCKEVARKSTAKKRATPKGKVDSIIGTAIWKALKGNKAGRHWETLVGYTLDSLIKHLERQFTEGMGWNTYGKDGWVIDHKIPRTVFNYTKPEHEDFKKCWALSNLQPLWAEDNNFKRAKITKHFQPSLAI